MPWVRIDRLLHTCELTNAIMSDEWETHFSDMGIESLGDHEGGGLSSLDH